MGTSRQCHFFTAELVCPAGAGGEAAAFDPDEIRGRERPVEDEQHRAVALRE